MRLLLLAFMSIAPLLFSGVALSLHLFVILGAAMAPIKNTTTTHQPEDNVDLEVIDASTCDDTTKVSSAFNQEASEGIPVRVARIVEISRLGMMMT
jgi:hypothetical protein